MVGLGHIRRHLLIAQAFMDAPTPPVVLLLAEAREAGALAMPDGVDCFTLPGIRKDIDGQCHPRHLDLPLPSLVALRQAAIRAVLHQFAPDVLIVDHLPLGALGELEPALSAARATGRARCVLGLRDVLDEPHVVRQDWQRSRALAAIRDYYDAIWIYGDPGVYDGAREYGFPADIRAKVHYTGYLDSRRRLGCEATSSTELAETLRLPSGELVVCTVGGGHDGGPLAEAFVRAAFPPNTHGVLISGPFMPPAVRRQLHRRAARNPRVRIFDFVSEPARLLRRADRIISMGGYNSVCDILSFRKPALVIPRARPRREQLLRAERLETLGAFDVLHPSAVSPHSISEWLARRPAESHSPPRVDVSGLRRLPRLLGSLLLAQAGPGAAAAHGACVVRQAG
jgi:predicted glycosyltransferase